MLKLMNPGTKNTVTSTATYQASGTDKNLFSPVFCPDTVCLLWLQKPAGAQGRALQTLCAGVTQQLMFLPQPRIPRGFPGASSRLLRRYSTDVPVRSRYVRISGHLLTQ